MNGPNKLERYMHWAEKASLGQTLCLFGPF